MDWLQTIDSMGEVRRFELQPAEWKVHADLAVGGRLLTKAKWAANQRTGDMGLNRLRKKSEFRSTRAKDIPQRLKPMLISEHLWHD